MRTILSTILPVWSFTKNCPKDRFSVVGIRAHCSRCGVSKEKHPQNCEIVAGMIKKNKELWLLLKLSNLVQEWVLEGFKANFYNANFCNHFQRPNLSFGREITRRRPEHCRERAWFKANLRSVPISMCRFAATFRKKVGWKQRFQVAGEIWLRFRAISDAEAEKAMWGLISLRNLKNPLPLQEKLKCTGTIVSVFLVIGSSTYKDPSQLQTS